jgi:hypothetical protein
VSVAEPHRCEVAEDALGRPVVNCAACRPLWGQLGPYATRALARAAAREHEALRGMPGSAREASR